MSTGFPLVPRDLKRAVSILHVLEHRGLASHLRRAGPRFVGPCPIHGGDNPRAFVVHPDKNLWYCFSRCQDGGDLIDLVRRLDQASFHQALRTLAALAHSAPAPIAYQPPRHRCPTAEPFRPYTRRLPLDPNAPFLRAKGIRPATARTFQAGEYDGNGFLRDCVAVRLHDPHGNPLGYAGRHLLDLDCRRYGKWKLPPRMPKSKILFNFHRVRQRLATTGVVLVECPWGVMRLAQIGVPALALLGTALSPAQRKLIVHAKRVLILLDADTAGHSAAPRILHALATHTHTSIAHLPNGRDPDDLTDLDLHRAVQPLYA